MSLANWYSVHTGCALVPQVSEVIKYIFDTNENRIQFYRIEMERCVVTRTHFTWPLSVYATGFHFLIVMFCIFVSRGYFTCDYERLYIRTHSFFTSSLSFSLFLTFFLFFSFSFSLSSSFPPFISFFLPLASSFFFTLTTHRMCLRATEQLALLPCLPQLRRGFIGCLYTLSADIFGAHKSPAAINRPRRPICN